MKSPLRDLFDFSKKEQVGLSILVSIILTCLIILNFHHVLFPEEKVDASKKEKQLLAAIEAAQESEKEKRKQTNKYSEKGKSLPIPIYFDPNSLDSVGYVSLGFSPKQASSIRKYFDKGGRVIENEDFKKIYVVNDFMFKRLKDYIRIKKVKEQRSSPELTEKVDDPIQGLNEKPQDQPIVVDLNNTDSDELISLKGIGPIYSKRIQSYGNLLGGYYSVDQLYEVYGLKDNPDIIESLRPTLKADVSGIKKIDINGADWKSLVKHPYINDKVANSIVKMRESRGLYESIGDISESHLISDELLQKISPYLMVID